MKTKNIYIIRHGQTDYNLQGKVQGRGINSSINATGRKQANEFFHAYKEISYDKIYTSDLKRTKESVQQFIDLGIPYEALSGLDEISWGRHEGESFDPIMHQLYLDTVAGWERGDLDLSVGDGESPKEVMQRQKDAISTIMSRVEEKNVLIATHGRAMRIMICWMLNYPLQQMDAFEHTNLCLYHLQHTGSRYRLVQHGSTSHLTV